MRSIYFFLSEKGRESKYDQDHRIFRLRDERARAVAGAADLLAALGLHTRQAAPAAAKQPAPLSDTERRVLAGIGPKPVGIEELCVSTGLPMSALLGTLMKLELTGRVYKQPGQRYVLR